MTDDPHRNRDDRPSAGPANTKGQSPSPKNKTPSPARPDSIDDPGPETPPRQPGTESAWSLAGAPSKSWGSLNLTGTVELLLAGDYDAVVANVDVIDKGNVLWMVVGFALIGEEASPAPLLGMLDSRNMAEDQHRVSEGRRLLNKLLTATRTPPEAVDDPFDLPDLLAGKPVRLTLFHKIKDGIIELAIRTIRPRI